MYIYIYIHSHPGVDRIWTFFKEIISKLGMSLNIPHSFYFRKLIQEHTWWLIPLSKWVITPVINGISRVNPLTTGVITHLLSGMSHQVDSAWEHLLKPDQRSQIMANSRGGFTTGTGSFCMGKIMGFIVILW